MAKSNELRYDTQLNEVVKNLFQPTSDPSRAVLEMTWFRNILYYIGEQWLAWYPAQGTFGRRYEMNVQVPTPVSNIIRDYVRSLKALTLNKKYKTMIWPNSEEQEDRDAADLGIRLLESLDNRNDNEIEDIKEGIELSRVITGSGFSRALPLNDTGQYITDGKGNLVVNAGDVCDEVILPFNVMVPTHGSTLDDKPVIGIKSLRTKEWVEDTFKVLISADESTMEVDYQKQLLQLVANVSPWKGRSAESGGTDILDVSSDQLVVFKELEFRPFVSNNPKRKSRPKGRYTSICGDKILIDQDDLLIPTDKSGRWNYTLTHYPYDLVLGSFWPSGAVDDLISPQNTINRIDQALETNRDSFGRPWLMSPSEVTLKRISSRNQGILAIEYNGREAAGSRPLMIPGTPYPSQILEERQIQQENAQMSAGDPKNILKGQSPSSGASGIMLDILRETAEQSHTPDISRFYRALNRHQRKRLILAQHIYTEERTLKTKGEGNRILVKKFKGADLRDNTDVRLELDSGISSTQAGKNEVLTRLIEAGFWGPISERPQIQRELLKRMGMSGFPEENNLHRDRAELENSKMRDGKADDIAFQGIPDTYVKDPTTGDYVMDQTGEPIVDQWAIKPGIDPVFRLDNHLIHMQVHDQYILSREFKELTDELQALAVGHRLMHEMAHEAEMAKQMEAMAAQEQGKSTQSSNPGKTMGLAGGSNSNKSGPSMAGQ